jgi:hypothetical protein
MKKKLSFLGLKQIILNMKVPKSLNMAVKFKRVEKLLTYRQYSNIFLILILMKAMNIPHF